MGCSHPAGAEELTAVYSGAVHHRLPVIEIRFSLPLFSRPVWPVSAIVPVRAVTTVLEEQRMEWTEL